jgi:hypothetical protein
MMPLYPSTSVSGSSTVKGPDLPQVSSVDELSQLATQPNSRYAYFDKNQDYVYVVQTNENNYKTIRRFAFYEDPIPKPEDNYATKQEILDLKGDIANVQQSLQQLIEQTRFRPKNKHGKADVQNNSGFFQSAAVAAANGYDQSTAAVSVSNDISG